MFMIGKTIVAGFAGGLLALAAAHGLDRATAAEQDLEIIRAQRIQLVDADGQLRGELHLGDVDGSGNFRLFDGAGRIRVKLGTSLEGATGLLLMDDSIEPAVRLLVDQPKGPRLEIGGLVTDVRE
jgi:hypothetical protein